MKVYWWRDRHVDGPLGKLVCIRCGQRVEEDTYYNEAEDRTEEGYTCLVCGLSTWKAQMIMEGVDDL
jgi:DNA-directed RNA polymerase subunit RPC12/RpoP